MAILPTYQQTPPRRPGIDDLGGTGKAKRASAPAPDPVRDLTPDDAVQLAQTTVALAQTGALLRLSLSFSVSIYSVDRLGCVRSDVSPASFTVVRNGTGDVSITCPGVTLPPSQGYPSAHVLGAVDGRCTVAEIVNGWRVYLRGSGGTAADFAFRLDVF
jgi:hypothetical protein